MSVNIDFLKKQYFYFDKPVPYLLNNNKVIEITPVKVVDSEVFLSSLSLISEDKNSYPDPKIIQMSYLQFIVEVKFENNANIQALVNICKLCLGINHLGLRKNELGRYILIDQDSGLTINQKQFDEIRNIILYQNIYQYDNEYVHPDLKKALDETQKLKNKNFDMPTLERKIAIITSHCGISKKEQLDMTYRSHDLLFQEVCGEVEYSVVAPIALYCGKKSEIDNWIFKKQRNKFDDGIISVESYNKIIGGDGNIEQGSISNDINKHLNK